MTGGRIDPLRMSRRVDAATNKPDRAGNFYKTSRNLIADRFLLWWYSPCMEVSAWRKGGLDFLYTYARKPPVWIKAGDTIGIGIEAIGILSNSVEDEA